jgi:hypothetical protein
MLSILRCAQAPPDRYSFASAYSQPHKPRAFEPALTLDRRTSEWAVLFVQREMLSAACFKRRALKLEVVVHLDSKTLRS